MLCVERCLLSCLVPVNLKAEERMERMINVYTTLEDENACKYMCMVLNVLVYIYVVNISSDVCISKVD